MTTDTLQHAECRDRHHEGHHQRAQSDDREEGSRSPQGRREEAERAQAVSVSPVSRRSSSAARFRRQWRGPLVSACLLLPSTTHGSGMLKPIARLAVAAFAAPARPGAPLAQAPERRRRRHPGRPPGGCRQGRGAPRSGDRRPRRPDRVGPAGAARLPAGARVIDLSRYTVLPGLIDCHTHLIGDASGGRRAPAARALGGAGGVQRREERAGDAAGRLHHRARRRHLPRLRRRRRCATRSTTAP